MEPNKEGKIASTKTGLKSVKRTTLEKTLSNFLLNSSTWVYPSYSLHFNKVVKNSRIRIVIVTSKKQKKKWNKRSIMIIVQNVQKNNLLSLAE